MFEFDIVTLSDEFYECHSKEEFPELLISNGCRKYNLILYDQQQDYYVAVPFRSHVNHNNGYHFKASKRSQRTLSGLDYSKAVILTDDSFIGEQSRIDADEYTEFLQNIATIQDDIFEYIETYKQIVSGNMEMSTEEYRRSYGYSSLKYFHEELELEKAEQCEEQE